MSYGLKLSPEFFDKRLPVSTPLRKGATPKGASLPIAATPGGLLKRQSIALAIAEETPSPKKAKASPKSAKKATPSPKSSKKTTPSPKSTKKATPSPKSAKKATQSPKSAKKATPGPKSAKKATPSPKGTPKSAKKSASKTPKRRLSLKDESFSEAEPSVEPVKATPSPKKATPKVT